MKFNYSDFKLFLCPLFCSSCFHHPQWTRCPYWCSVSRGYCSQSLRICLSHLLESEFPSFLSTLCSQSRRQRLHSRTSSPSTEQLYRGRTHTTPDRRSSSWPSFHLYSAWWHWSSLLSRWIWLPSSSTFALACLPHFHPSPPRHQHLGRSRHAGRDGSSRATTCTQSNHSSCLRIHRTQVGVRTLYSQILTRQNVQLTSAVNDS